MHYALRYSTYFPKLLRRILACHALEDLGATGVLVYKVGHVVDVLVDNDVHALVSVVVAGNVGGGEGLGHGECWSETGGCPFWFLFLFFQRNPSYVQGRNRGKQV